VRQRVGGGGAVHEGGSAERGWVVGELSQRRTCCATTTGPEPRAERGRPEHAQELAKGADRLAGVAPARPHRPRTGQWPTPRGSIKRGWRVRQREGGRCRPRRRGGGERVGGWVVVPKEVRARAGAIASSTGRGMIGPAPRRVELARVGERVTLLGCDIEKWLCEALSLGRLPICAGSSRGVAEAAFGLARRPACGFPEPRADLRADLRAASRSRVRTCVRLCAARFCGPHPPSPPSDRPSRGWGIQKSGTKLGEVLARRSKIFSLCNRWTRIGSHGPVSSPRLQGGRLPVVSSGGQGARGSTDKPSGR